MKISSNVFAIAVLLLLSMPGCVSVGYHSQKKAEIREADYGFAKQLIEKVQLGQLTPRDMLIRLKIRYNKQEQEDLQ